MAEELCVHPICTVMASISSMGLRSGELALMWVGGIGIILHCAILSLSLYQIALYLGDRHELFPSLSPSLTPSRQIQLKLLFHVIFGGYSLFDLLYYVSLYFSGTYTQWGYSFHLISLLIHLFAFVLV